MNNFFDYDGWIDETNKKGGLKKAKPDASRKKKKKGFILKEK